MENGYTQLVNSPTRGNALLDVDIIRPESAFTSGSDVQGISDHRGVLLEVEWVVNCGERQVEILVTVCHKTNVSGLHGILRGKFVSWARNGSCVEEMWKIFRK